MYYISRKIGVISLWALFAVSMTYAQDEAPQAVPDAAAPGEAGEVVEQEVSRPRPAQPKFNIWQYEVRGASSIPAVEIQKTLYPFLGPGKSLNIVEEAAAALIELFDSNGYAAAVDIPPQDVVNGVVILQVTEGRISRLNVTGSRYFLPSDIKKEIPSAAKGNVLDTKALQEDLSELNERSSYLSVTPALSPGKRPGDLNVDLKVYDRVPATASLTLNDHYSAYTTKLRLSGSLSYQNLWQKLHSVSLWAQTNPEETDESKVFSLGYGLPLGWNNRLSFNYVKSESETDTPTTVATNGFFINGNADIFSASYMIRPDFTKRGFFTLRADYKEVEEDVTSFDESTGEPVTIQTPIEYYLLSGDFSHYHYNDAWSGSVNFGFRSSIRSLNDADEFGDKRLNARASFFILTTRLEERYALPGDFGVRGRFEGQYSDQPLISNEQFRIGGSTSVRGYLESQELGDYGYIAALEFETPKLFGDSEHQLRAHLFYDYGRAATKPSDNTVFLLPSGEPSPGSLTDSYKLASYGAGLRYSFGREIDASVEWAHPLRDSCESLTQDEIDSGVQRCSKEPDVETGEERVTFNFSVRY